MTVDDALKAMAAIDGQNDGSNMRKALVEILYRKLLDDPENFWETYFEAMSETRPNDYREQAKRLLRSGVVTEDTTFGDIPTIIAWDAARSR